MIEMLQGAQWTESSMLPMRNRWAAAGTEIPDL